MKQMVRKLVDSTVVPVVEYVIRKTRDRRERSVLDVLVERALVDSADYAEEHMRNALNFWTRQQLWDFALSRMEFEGLIAEFGVFKGNSINYFARKLKTKIYGFDSFEGLQEDWTGHEVAKGHFSLGGQLPQVEENVVLVKGWFDETLPKFLLEHQGMFAFVHIDCDTYHATKVALGLLTERLQAGTVIVFDEYFGFRGWQLGEFKAWKEFTESKHISYDYIGFGPVQVAVMIR